jgi:hypothetical protein
MDAKTRRVFVARDVVFDENLLPARKALDLLEAKMMVKHVSAKTGKTVQRQQFWNAQLQGLLKSTMQPPLFHP